ncbi:MAG: hypothetical protein KGN02_11825 [bacterium]|nr:hypothetical protein [bacterium]
MRILAFLTLATLVAGGSILVGRAQSASPVSLNSCTLEYSDPSSLASRVDGLRAQFTNNSSKTAHVVNISADINGTKQIIRDEGTFSPGIEINHRYRVGGGQFALPSVLASIFGKPAVTCTIASVEFADGTKWSADANEATMAAATTPAIAVQPSVLALHGIGSVHARLGYASGGGSLALSSNCGQVASVEILGSTHVDLAFRVTPKAAGTCTISLRDINDNLATIPVSVTP